MIIKNCKIANFRSHEEFLLSCDKMTTMITGENGGGKTSILEAIYIALSGKSFRATDKEIVKRGENFYRIEVLYEDGEKTIVTFSNNKKEFFVGDKKFGRLPKKYKYPVVLFVPDDMGIVSASPTRKRDYFDRTFTQLSEEYNNSLLKYNKTLKQRNELLKDEFLKSEMLFSWNVLLAKYGAEIMRFRERNIAEINEDFTRVYRTIADNNDEVKLEYKTQEMCDESGFLRHLEESFEKDKIVGHTTFGIHHDDYDFMFNRVLAEGSASRGEVRSVVLALKFIETNLATKKIGKRPLVLLDDVFSELDETRQKCLVKNFKENQVIITSVNPVEDV